MKNYKKIKIKFKLIIIFLLFIFIISYTEANIRNNIKQVSNHNSNIIANEIISDVVTEELKNSEIKYNQLVQIKYNDNQEITSVQTDNFYINQLQSNINNKIIDKLQELDVIKIDINLGSLTSSKFLYAKGPKITMNAKPVGKLNTKIISEFKSTGINQTIHRLNINLSLNITTMLGFYTNTENISIDIPISETIIVGKVPEYYTSVIGESEETLSKINEYSPNNQIKVE